MTAALEPIVGRYVTLEVAGRRCRVYFEEAGQGIPLVCLHTPGADGRQYRHMMCDEAVTSRGRGMSAVSGSECCGAAMQPVLQSVGAAAWKLEYGRGKCGPAAARLLPDLFCRAAFVSVRKRTRRPQNLVG